MAISTQEPNITRSVILLSVRLNTAPLVALYRLSNNHGRQRFTRLAYDAFFYLRMTFSAS